MIRFELSPQPCQPRVNESASHIRYPNIDYQSATTKNNSASQQRQPSTIPNSAFRVNPWSTAHARKNDREIVRAKNFIGSLPTYRKLVLRTSAPRTKRAHCVTTRRNPLRTVLHDSPHRSGRTREEPSLHTRSRERSRSEKVRYVKEKKRPPNRRAAKCALSESNREPTD